MPRFRGWVCAKIRFGAACRISKNCTPEVSLRIRLPSGNRVGREARGFAQISRSLVTRRSFVSVARLRCSGILWTAVQANCQFVKPVTIYRNDARQVDDYFIRLVTQFSLLLTLIATNFVLTYYSVLTSGRNEFRYFGGRLVILVIEQIFPINLYNSQNRFAE